MRSYVYTILDIQVNKYEVFNTAYKPSGNQVTFDSKLQVCHSLLNTTRTPQFNRKIENKPPDLQNLKY